MPRYLFICPSCGLEEELDLKISERDDPVHCTVCAEEMERTVGNAGFILKGNCWGRDNYARNLGDDPRYNQKTGQWNNDRED